MSRVEQIGDCTLYLGNSLEIVSSLLAPAAVVTSPPYGQQRDYGKVIDDWRALVSGALCPTPDRGDTQVLVNLGLIHRKCEVVPYWQPFIDDMRAAGWRQFGWYVWDQGPGMPGDWHGRLAPSFEFIFHFNRAARRPNKTVRCQAVSHSAKSFRNTDGTMRLPNSPHLFGQTHKIADNVIRIPRRGTTGIERGHPATFPVPLPAELIAAYTGEGETVLDPFMGSGTTGVAAVELGRKFVGIDLEPAYFDIACRRIEAAVAAHKDMRIAA